MLHERWGLAPRRRVAGPVFKLPRRCVGLRTRVVSRSRKRRRRLRQVRTRKANESEPPMRRRKRLNTIETRLRMYAWDEARKGPVYGPGGGRRRGGASLVQALVWNVGTRRFDVKGEIQGEIPRRVSVPMRSAGADWLVVAVKPGNAGGAKRPDRPASGVGQPVRGGVHV